MSQRKMKKETFLKKCVQNAYDEISRQAVNETHEQRQGALP